MDINGFPNDGIATLGTGTLSVLNGFVVATFKTSGLKEGKHSVTADYSGDAKFAASQTAVLIETIKR